MRTRRRQSSSRRNERGAAILAVVALIAMVTIAVLEFRYDTDVDYASAINARDEMRAHFIARSVMNLSRMVIKVQHDILDKNRRQLASLGLPDVQIGDFMSMLETPFCGTKGEIAGMASLANLNADGIKGLGLDFGQCHVEVFDSDDGKTNVNCANGTAPTVNALGTALTGLVQSPAFDKMFQEKDGDGQLTDRQLFVRGLIDYVDRDEAAWGASGQPEDYGYESLKDPYKAKNNYIDSVDELQLARGMDDRKWALFGPQLTVYGGCKINVSANISPIQVMGLIANSAKDPNDPVLKDPVKLWTLALRVSQARGMGMPFADLNGFIDFVKDPDAALGTKSASGTTTATATPTSSAAPAVDGIVLDPAKLNLVARAGARRTYRVVAAAQVGRVQKRIQGVFDTETHNQNMRDPAYAQGTWVYWREE
jgi:general secretion pathway protein K